MGNTIGKKGKDKHSRKRELEVLVLLTGKGDAGKKDLSGRRTGVSEGLPGAAEFQSMAKSLGLAADATMADLNPSQMPSLDDVVHMADTGDVENAFITLQDRLLMFPDDVDSMTVFPPPSLLPRSHQVIVRASALAPPEPVFD
ncbi:hypothetical protein T484DRAFT_1888708 [Baffinella frigidus]|nr:hypothetical protein T484DRAFT_1888708 [Cryptophyta sp. CCMP2293]